MKSILQSIKPQYCELIASGKKTIEVRKTRPKLDVPFKVYIYCTKDKLLTKSHNNGNIYLSENKYKSALEKAGNVTLSGKVIGEYVCNNIEPKYCANGIATYYENEQGTCLSDAELQMYADGVKPLYFWHISDLKIYDKPKELSEFHKPCINPGMKICELCEFADFENTDVLFPRCINVLIHPPQSWCYVEEGENVDKS